MVDIQEEIGFDTYQKLSRGTAVYLDVPIHTMQSELLYVVYVALGLASESGEVAGVIKKAIRDNHGFISPETKSKLESELGDCLWYLSQLCEEIGSSLSRVAVANLTKLHNRKQRNVLQGSGDNR